MIVLDASAALAGLMSSGAARDAMGAEQLHAPHMIDSEVASGLRRQVGGGNISAGQARSMLRAWRSLGVSRYPAVGMLERIWELRENLSAYDATYVALAEALECPLLTADRRLSRATGLRCAVTTVPG